MKKTYTKGFKLTIVKLAESGQPTKVLSEEYGICKSTINAWRRSYKKNDSGKVKEELSVEEQHIRDLKKHGHLPSCLHSFQERLGNTPL